MKHYVKIIRYRVVNEPLRGVELVEGEAPEQQPQILESAEFEFDTETGASLAFEDARESLTPWHSRDPKYNDEDIPF